MSLFDFFLLFLITLCPQISPRVESPLLLPARFAQHGHLRAGGEHWNTRGGRNTRDSDDILANSLSKFRVSSVFDSFRYQSGDFVKKLMGSQRLKFVAINWRTNNLNRVFIKAQIKGIGNAEKTKYQGIHYARDISFNQVYNRAFTFPISLS
jgi:hypothetical protein